MQNILYKIWTQVAVSISYEDNYCTKSAPIYKHLLNPSTQKGK